MKRIATLGTLCAALGAVLSSSPAWSDIKIGYVDYARLLEESPQAKAAADSLRNEFGARQRELQNEQTSLKTKEEKLTKDGATMSEEQRGRAEKELRDGARDLQRKGTELQDDLNARRNEENGRLQRTVVEEVRTYAKAQNYDLIIADGVIYYTGAVDITPAILTGLQARAANAKPSAPASTPAQPAKTPSR